MADVYPRIHFFVQCLQGVWGNAAGQLSTAATQAERGEKENDQVGILCKNIKHNGWLFMALLN